MRGLVADDEEGIRNVIREYLEFDGHTVAEAANGAEAVSLCRMQKFGTCITRIENFWEKIMSEENSYR